MNQRPQFRPVLAELLCEFRRLRPDWARGSCSKSAVPASRDRGLARGEFGRRPPRAADQHSCFLLECHGLLSTETATARPVFERVFREYGRSAGTSSQ